VNLTLKVNGVDVPAEKRPLLGHSAGLSFTQTGYGKKIPTQYVVRYKNRWRRVYSCVFSNSGSLYITGKTDTLSPLWVTE
jgi:hypothetical protein